MTSSFTLSVGSRALEVGRARLSEIGVWATFALGVLFLLVKGLEYHDDLTKHPWPGTSFALRAPAARIFWGLYWVSTGLHACHITIGLGLLGRLGWMARVHRLTANTDSVEATPSTGTLST